MSVVTSVKFPASAKHNYRIVGLIHRKHRAGFKHSNCPMTIKPSDFDSALKFSEKTRKASEDIHSHGQDIFFKN